MLLRRGGAELGAVLTSTFCLQDKAITGQNGLLVLKSVKRTDSGTYKCQGLDYDNLEADLTGIVALTVHCERAPCSTHTNPRWGTESSSVGLQPGRPVHKSPS